ncbi:MAG: hypothetical protein V9E81_03900 [Marmoricola sp.]
MRQRVSHHTPTQARKRLAGVVERAGMIRSGVTHYKSTDGPVVVPAATLEIDIDNENDLHHRVYMWARACDTAAISQLVSTSTSPTGRR